MTTLQMEIALMQYFGIQKHLIVPNITTMSGLTSFETDLVVLTKAGYCTGVEIKISKGDLKADLKKKQWKDLDKVWNGITGFEYYFKIFKKFYYAVPIELKEDALNQIPSWCGLLYVKKFKVVEERTPKILFLNKWSEKKRYELARLGTMRILGLKSKILNCKK